MDHDQKVEQLEKEFRDDIRKSLQKVWDQLAAMSTELKHIREDTAGINVVSGLNARVSKLENDRATFVGAIIVIQALGALVILVANKLWK